MLEQQGFFRFRIDACPEQPLVIPDFGGSMLRGALGHALAYIDQAAYDKIFDPGLGHAFLMTPPQAQRLKAGDVFTFYVTLFPSVSELHDVFFRALTLALRKGLSATKVPCQLLLFTKEIKIFSPLPHQFRLNLLSPWFVKFRNNPVLAEHFSFSTFLIALARRQGELVKREFLQAIIPTNQELLEVAEAVRSQEQLYNVFGERRSNRQQVKHPLQGVSGYFDITINHQEHLNLLSPLLHRAQWLHGGSKVSFGLGALHVKPLSSPVSQLEQLRQNATGAGL
ncbi:hypothetical protein CBP31_13100 [Oceanisphaera profunda]|uniref:CRISPR-associated protein Cas6 C-terminal domain-containing protein n=1 Tax=Oceanisphaera profunda TaxID=1416627 RepID=A0A1Y0D847_9GAMM|nr:CRISPR system precrRNA processing endoribonuclease RAMP protein Cas6 [Oceanisphaera profunda]ART83444.1 hypothetical protein CBP31_13100 [Oceanisphaera profunda]